MDLPPPKHAGKAVDRFVFFSDAVFAFALTLQAITLKLPQQPETKVPTAELLRTVIAAAPSLLCYVLTFSIVAVLWARHHRMFEKLRDYDGPLIVLNFALLFTISLFPFVTQLVIAALDVRLPYMFYGGLTTLIGLVALGIWWHLQRTPGLLEETLGPAERRRELIRQLFLVVGGLAILGGAVTLSREQFPMAMVALAVVTIAVRKYTRT